MGEAKDYIPGLGSQFKISPDEIDTGELVEELEELGIGGGGEGGPITADQITDASAVGKSVLKAADAAAARSAIGAGTSSLTLGTTGSTALAGNGTAAAATKLATARTLALTGGATGSATFDGSANASISVTLATATTAAAGAVKQAVAQADSSATDAAGLAADFNALLAKLRTAGILAP
ncbi:Head fiber protein [compost metagenome]